MVVAEIKMRSLVLLHGMGLIFLLVLYGIIQEKILTSEYKDVHGFSFHYQNVPFLILINRTFAIILSILLFRHGGSSGSLLGFRSRYGFISLSNYIASVCQYFSLKYVTFTTQTIFKACKNFPTVLVRSLVFRKVPQASDLYPSIGILFGCSLYMYSGDLARYDDQTGMIGIVLLVLYLVFDGMASSLQEKSLTEDESPYKQMFCVNVISAIISWLSLPDSAMIDVYRIAGSPTLCLDIVLLGLTSAFSQLLIYHCIDKYDAITYSTIMTTRHMLSICFSNFFYGAQVTPLQWIGGFLVIISLYSKAFMYFRTSDLKCIQDSIANKA